MRTFNIRFATGRYSALHFTKNKAFIESFSKKIEKKSKGEKQEK